PHHVSPGPRQFPPPLPPLAPAVPDPDRPPPLAPAAARRRQPPDSATAAGVPATRPRRWISRSTPDPVFRSRRPHLRLEIWVLGLGEATAPPPPPLVELAMIPQNWRSWALSIGEHALCCIQSCSSNFLPVKDCYGDFPHYINVCETFDA
ncbi:unnamed protein product, partial [Urochloa humidicola]